MAGYYLDGSTKSHGFTYDGVSFTTRDHPLGTKGTWILGICGDYMVGEYIDASGGHGFVYDGAEFQTMDHPLATAGGYANGIAGNLIVGQFIRSLGQYGYVTTLVPECHRIAVNDDLVLTGWRKLIGGWPYALETCPALPAGQWTTSALFHAVSPHASCSNPAAPPSLFMRLRSSR